MKKTVLMDEWLASSAVVAFGGVFLMARYLQLPDSEKRLSFVVTFPPVPDWIVLTLSGILFVTSFVLAAASIKRGFRSWVIRKFAPFSPTLWLFVLIAFTLSWLAAFVELPMDKWWSKPVFYGGFGMFLFVVLTIARRALNDRASKGKNDSESDGSGEVATGGEPGRTRLLERMRNLRTNFKLPDTRGFWMGLSVVIAVFGVVFAVVFWDWLSHGESGSTTIRNVGLVVGGSIALILAIWRGQVADKQASTAQHQAEIAQHSLLNERYEKGAQMLGSNVLAARIGGVHALHRLAREHPEQYHVQIMYLFCGFARNPAGDQELVTEKLYSDIHFPMLRADLQDIMGSFQTRRDADIALEKSAGFGLRLYYANLRGAILTGADLRGAMLLGADLSGAYLANTRLNSATLSEVNLTDTQFSNVGDNPATGLTQSQLDIARADPKWPPRLRGVLDAITGKPLVWRGKPLVDPE